jgi:hypothetical protein
VKSLTRRRARVTRKNHTTYNLTTYYLSSFLLFLQIVVEKIVKSFPSRAREEDFIYFDASGIGREFQFPHDVKIDKGKR